LDSQVTFYFYYGISDNILSEMFMVNVSNIRVFLNLDVSNLGNVSNESDIFPRLFRNL